MTKKKPPAPAHLQPETRAWWVKVTGDYQLEDHHLRLLQLACEAWDRSQQAREILAVDGIVFRDDRSNVRAHPAITVEKDARIAFARLVREMDLDTEPPPSNRVGPPSLRSNNGRV